MAGSLTGVQSVPATLYGLDCRMQTELSGSKSISEMGTKDSGESNGPNMQLGLPPLRNILSIHRLQ